MKPEPKSLRQVATAIRRTPVESFIGAFVLVVAAFGLIMAVQEASVYKLLLAFVALWCGDRLVELSRRSRDRGPLVAIPELAGDSSGDMAAQDAAAVDRYERERAAAVAVAKVPASAAFAFVSGGAPPTAALLLAQGHLAPEPALTTILAGLAGFLIGVAWWGRSLARARAAQARAAAGDAP